MRQTEWQKRIAEEKRNGIVQRKNRWRDCGEMPQSFLYNGFSPVLIARSLFQHNRGVQATIIERKDNL